MIVRCVQATNPNAREDIVKHLNGRWPLIALVAALGGCAREGDAPPQDVASTLPNVVNLSATEFAFQAPDTIPSGWTTFRLANNGSEIHYGHVVQLDSGRTVSELVAAYAEAIRTSGPRPKWVTRFGGPGGTVPGDTSSVTQHLEPGTYVWICPVEDSTGAPHFGKGEFKQFVVREADAAVAGRAAAPKADLTIGLLDFSFAIDSVVPAGRHTVRVHNTGVEPHDLVLIRLAPGMTPDDVRAAMNPERARRDAPSEPPPTFESLGTGAGGVAAMRPGMESFFERDFTPGTYVMLCMATAPDGRSHIEHGMVQTFTVR